MMGMCTAITVSTAAPPLYPGWGEEKWKTQLLCTTKNFKITKKFTKYTKCANVAQQYPHPVRCGMTPNTVWQKSTDAYPHAKKSKKSDT